MKKKILISVILSAVMIMSSACSFFDKDNSEEESKESSSVSESDSESESEDENSDKESSEAEESEDENSDKESSEAEEESEDESTSSEEVSANLSDDIFNFEIALDGEVYSIPMSYKDFTENGWILDGDDTEKLKGNQYTLSEVFEKEDFKISCQIINLDDDEKPLSECYIGKISIDSYDLKDTNHTAEILNGIKVNVSSMDNVDASLGEPDDKYEGDSIIIYTYKKELYSEIKITFDTQTKIVTEIEMQNFNE
ncbi:hypothetical protein [Porcipelethomonas sp.]|uniref:hypothetical protein n=1 Tax=Porcipelethomonas sp. TaxID=2981675 RepID=UPI003EF1E2AA